VLIFVSVCVGLLITRVLDDSVAAFDLTVTQKLVAHRSALVDRFTGVATVPADSIAVAVLWVSAMVIAAWRTRAALLSLFLLVAIGGEKLTYVITSEIVRRPRPHVQALGHVFDTGSFPSGHVGSAITLYGGIVVMLLCYDSVTRKRWRSLAVRIPLGVAVAAIAVIVAFSRVYRGHHYLSDVTWGAVLGVSWLTIGWYLTLRRRQPSDLVGRGDVAKRSVEDDGGAHRPLIATR
jgi:undecaprenyl-diphosphatase